MGSAAPRVVGRYTIHDKIASGGMASVHFGRVTGSAGFARTVAIKRLHPHLACDPIFATSFVDEARLAARIHHPNVVATLDVVAAEDELLLVMEYVRGESLSQLLYESIRAGVWPTLPIVSAIASGALHGLHAAHEAVDDRGAPLDIVHRDVSPQNVLVGVDGVARIIDFGIAKAAGRLQTTRDGALKGKLAYMSPEQIRGEKLTRASDVYAMSVVFWEMIAGRRLFKGEDQGAVFGAVLAGATAPPSRYAPATPPALDALVMRGLMREPRTRFSTALEMAEALAAVVPPATAAEVGRWTSEIARRALAERQERVAKIESGAPDESQSSSVSLDSAGHARPSRSRGLLVAAASGGLVVLAAAVGVTLHFARRAPAAPLAPPPVAASAEIAPIRAPVASSAPAPPPPTAKPSVTAAPTNAPPPARRAPPRKKETGGIPSAWN